jgi:hypothetical protein
MKLFGLDFPEPKRPICETCAEPMILTGRMPDPRRGAGYETQVFECYACRREISMSVCTKADVEAKAEDTVKT